MLSPNQKVPLEESIERMKCLPPIEAAFAEIRDNLLDVAVVSYACSPEYKTMIVGRSHYEKEEEFARALGDESLRTWSHVHLFEKHGIPYFNALRLPMIFGHIKRRSVDTPIEIKEVGSFLLLQNAFVTMDLNRGDVTPDRAVRNVELLCPYFSPKTLIVCDPGKLKEFLPAGGYISEYVSRARSKLESDAGE